MFVKSPISSFLTCSVFAICAVNVGAESSHSGTAVNKSPVPVVFIGGPESDLESVPGFGVAPQNALRDDTIALWEAFRRDRIQQSCMAQAGFKYQPELAFPSGVTLQVANRLELPAPEAAAVKSFSGTTTAGMENRTNSDALPATQREGYFQTLYGESASDMDLVRSTGQLPPGRTDFARGGCYAKAWKAVPGVYSLKRKYAEAVRAARSSSAVNAGSAVTNPACVSASGAELKSLEDFDAALDRGEDIFQAIEAGCDKQAMKVSGQARIARENQIFAANRTALTGHRATYKNVMQKINGDRVFRGYLSVAAKELKHEMEDVERQGHKHD